MKWITGITPSVNGNFAFAHKVRGSPLGVIPLFAGDDDLKGEFGWSDLSSFKYRPASVKRTFQANSIHYRHTERIIGKGL